MSDTRESSLENVLEVLLARNRGARVAAFAEDGGTSPVPQSVPLTDHVVLDAPDGPGTLVDAADRPALDTAWAEMLTAGVSRRRARPRDGGHPFDLYLVDARAAHGVIVAICGDTAADGRTTEAPAPRVVRITKDYSAQNLTVGPEVTAMLGWLPEEMLARRTLEFLHPDDRQLSIDTWMDMLGNPAAPSRSRVRHLRKDGSYAWVEINNRNRLDEPGVGVVECDLVDISDEMEATEALRRTEQQFAKATAIAHVGGWELDPRTRRLQWSAETYRICGLDPATPPPLWEGFVALVPEDDRGRIDEALTRAIDTCRGFSLEHRLVRPQGEVRTVRTEARVDVVDGACGLVIGMIQDVTEQRRAAEERALLEQRVQEALRLESLGVLAGGIAHDFNNLLAVILGYATLGAQSTSQPEVAEHLEQIELAARRGAELTDQLLTYAGRSMREVVPVDVARTMLETVKLLSVSVPRGARLQTRHDGPGVVDGDPAQIRQIVMNLVTNGVEALPDGRGSVVARTSTTHLDRAGTGAMRIPATAGPGRYVCVEVTDDGEGIPDDVLRRVFEPFFSTRFTGRGLGLPAVLGIVQAHRGGIDIVTAPGDGTTFRVYLPASERRVTDEPTPARAAAARGAGTVLVVDDDAQVRDLSAAVMRRAGFETLTADGGAQTCAILETDAEIVAVVLDLSMDDVDGDAIIEELRARANDVPVVVVTGLPTAEANARVAHHGVMVVSKPYETAALVDAVIAAIARGRGRGG